MPNENTLTLPHRRIELSGQLELAKPADESKPATFSLNCYSGGKVTVARYGYPVVLQLRQSGTRYVVFQAVDGPLTDKQLEFAQRQSTRAEVSRWSLSVEYLQFLPRRRRWLAPKRLRRLSATYQLRRPRNQAAFAGRHALCQKYLVEIC